MASTYSPKLRFELIGAGEQAGLWGNTTNKNIGQLIEQAIAGVTTVDLTTDGGGTRVLTALDGAPDQSRSAVILCTGTPSGAVNVVVPTQTKLYVFRNECGQNITIKTAAQTGGVLLLNSEATLVFCDGTDAVLGLESAAAGTLPVSGGGTGSTTFTAGFVKSPGGTGALTSSATVALGSEVSGTLPVANGGTGAASLTANNVIIGNGTSAVQFVAPSTNGNILTSNGTTWVSLPPTGSGVTSFNAGSTGFSPSIASSGAVTLSGTLNLANGGTGATTQSGARTALGLGTIATQDSNNVNITGGSITGVSGIATLSGTQTFTGAKTFTGGITSTDFNFAATSSIYLTGGTVKVDISGTNTVVFDPSGGAYRMLFNNTNKGVKWDGTSLAVGWETGGTFIAHNSAFIEASTTDCRKPSGGTWNSTSDQRLKENIVDYTKGLTAVKALRPVNYNYNDVTKLGVDTNHKTFTGLIAQEVQQTAFSSMVIEGSDGYKVLDASEVTYALINAVKELSAQVDALKAEVAALKGA